MIHRGLRRDDLCNPRTCPDSGPEDERCDNCPLSRLEAFESSSAGQLLQRTNQLRAALEAGVTITLDEIPATEFLAMRLIEEELAAWEKEKTAKN